MPFLWKFMCGTKMHGNAMSSSFRSEELLKEVNVYYIISNVKQAGWTRYFLLWVNMVASCRTGNALIKYWQYFLEYN